MTITAHGKTWTIIGAPAVLESGARYLLGCGRCKTSCVSVARCRCCRKYKTRTAGGSPSFYPDDGKGHRQLMALSEFRVIARRALEAIA